MKTTFKHLTVVTAVLFLGIVGPSQAAVVVEPPGATVAGKTIAEWSTNWWRWAVALAPPGDPFTDTTGAFAGVNQSGPVFFLAGSPGGTRSRQFTVPADVYVLVPLLAGEWSQLELGFNQTAAQIRQAAQQQANQFNSLHATLDGVTIPQATLFTHRQASPDFNFISVAWNSVNVPGGASGIAVADGYFLMLKPLSPGTHVLTYGGASAFGIFISETDTITVVGPPPIITTQPTDQIVSIGSNATFSVSATTTNPPLRFQWQFSGTNRFRATNDTLTISNVQIANFGEYRVVVSDSVGSTNSTTVYLAPPSLPPHVTTQPTNLFVRAGSNAALRVSAGGTPPLYYQWRFNGLNLGGATNSALEITNVQSQQRGNYALVITNSYGAVTSSVAVVRLIAWLRTYNGPANHYDAASIAAVDGDGNVVVTGVSCADFSSCDYYTAKYSAADGALLWERRYNGAGNVNDSVTGMAVDSNGDVVVTGSSGTDFYTVKYAAANGAVIWEKHYDGPGQGQDYPYAVAVDPGGNVIVTGTSAGGPPNYDPDYCTIKYAAADGALLWEKRYNGPANTTDEGRAVAVDRDGNVVVTGASSTANGTMDYYTTKYAGTTGGFLWERRYNAPFNLDDYPNDLALDDSGNVVVTGVSHASNFQPDYYTAKYSATNGALIWERRYNGPGNDNDMALAVAVDNSGNVVVTGLSYNGAPYFDSDEYTAKYAAANGAVLWSKRYNGPQNSGDQAWAVVVDGNGNVLVLGYSVVSGIDSHSHLVAYAATNGATLWDYRHGNSAAYTLALDTQDNVVIAGSTNATDYLTLKILAGFSEVPTYRFTSITFTNGSVQINWTPAPGVVLQQTPMLNPPDWQTVVGSMNTNRITIHATNASGFFQLVKP